MFVSSCFDAMFLLFDNGCVLFICFLLAITDSCVDYNEGKFVGWRAAPSIYIVLVASYVRLCVARVCVNARCVCKVKAHRKKGGGKSEIFEEE